MKTLDERIAYYAKKVAQYGSVHPSKRRNPHRQQRLQSYQKAMHQIIDEEKTPFAEDVSKHRI